jgi:hypothetical protein
MPKILRDTQKDCGEPDCPNDHRSQVFSRGDEVIEQSGDFRFWHIASVIAAQRHVRSWGETGLHLDQTLPG